MGWNRNPRAHIKGTASWETSSREGTVAVELPCKAASRTIQRLPSKCPGNTRDQSPHESMHKITKLLQPLKPGLANGKGQISEPQSIPQHLFTDILRSWVGGLIWGCMMQWHRKWVGLNKCALRENKMHCLPRAVSASVGHTLWPTGETLVLKSSHLCIPLNSKC